MDFYLDYNNFYSRLQEEYLKYGDLIIAFDYDDTVYDFHKKGRSYKKVINTLKRWKYRAKFIVFTASNESRYERIREYLNDKGIPFDTINENVSDEVPQGYKVYYNVLLDDRAGLDMAVKALNQLMDRIELLEDESNTSLMEELLSKDTSIVGNRLFKDHVIRETINNLCAEGVSPFLMEKQSPFSLASNVLGKCFTYNLDEVERKGAGGYRKFIRVVSDAAVKLNRVDRIGISNITTSEIELSYIDSGKIVDAMVKTRCIDQDGKWLKNGIREFLMVKRFKDALKNKQLNVHSELINETSLDADLINELIKGTIRCR